MDTEQKAKAYDEALERAKEWYDDSQIGVGFKANLERLFPELAEPEDEKTRKEIISALKFANLKGVYDKHIAWLEKQGEQKPQRMISAEAKEGVLNEKQEEQVSEEFINALGTMLNDGLPDMYLVSEERIKKSAELLFSIVRKQLKNEKQGEQKPAWSEEDEHRINSIVYFLETAKKHYASTVELDACINWLKSLKPQNRWKPSDEQIEALDFAADCIVPTEFSIKRKVLKELLEQLKKLKGE